MEIIWSICDLMNRNFLGWITTTFFVQDTWFFLKNISIQSYMFINTIKKWNFREICVFCFFYVFKFATMRKNPQSSPARVTNQSSCIRFLSFFCKYNTYVAGEEQWSHWWSYLYERARWNGSNSYTIISLRWRGKWFFEGRATTLTILIIILVYATSYNMKLFLLLIVTPRDSLSDHCFCKFCWTLQRKTTPKVM